MAHRSRPPNPVLFALLLLAGQLGAASAGAIPREFIVTQETSLQFTNLGRAQASASSSGLATVHTSSIASSHLSTITLPATSLVSAVPVTDPLAAPITTIAFDVRRAGGPIGNVSGATGSVGALTPATLPMTGGITLCIISAVLPPCVPQLNLDVGGTSMGLPAGIGVGGLLTLGGSGTIRVSLVGAPYTVATVSAVASTANGGLQVFQENGFAHGPLSQTSSTAVTSGVLQIVTATRIRTVDPFGEETSGLISRTLIHALHVPEPRAFLLLASGAVAVAWLGRRRRPARRGSRLDGGFPQGPY